MNERLISPFTEEEVKKALFAIDGFKASGIDGMHAKKFQEIMALNWGCYNKGGVGFFAIWCDTARVE
jgi:hypothetical protein